MGDGAIFVYLKCLLKTKTKTLQAFSSDSTDHGWKGRPEQAPAWNRSDELIVGTDSAVRRGYGDGHAAVEPSHVTSMRKYGFLGTWTG